MPDDRGSVAAQDSATGADQLTSNLGARRRQHAAGENSIESEQDAEGSRKAPSMAVSSRSAEVGGQTERQTSVSKGKQPQDAGAHIAQPFPSGRSIENSIWDWDVPLGSSIDDASSYYYEPQGELLQEQREQRAPKTDFTIPHSVSTTGSHWPFPPTAANSNGGSGSFAVPPRKVPTPTAGVKRKSTSDQNPGSSQADAKRSSRSSAMQEDQPISPRDSGPPARSTRSQAGTRQRSATDTTEGRARPSVTDIDSFRPGESTSGPRRTLTDPNTPMILPARKVFPIQIGDKLFRLSGASISSDAPSYFSQFFEEQLRQNEGADSVRTLYIDRDPTTFEDISLHLQGYHIEPRDGPHFVKLFADAQFFSLPRLTAQLFASTIYIRIGDSEFQIPRDLFSSPGDSPNYFSLGFAIFFSTPTEVFPGLSQRTLLRPPSILPPSVPNRSAKTFADLLHILKGYPVEVRSEEHRQELLRDARYFHLKGLEQRLIPHQISYNLARGKSEILIRLEDIRQSGVSFVADNATPASTSSTSPASSTASNIPASPGWIHYQRPYADSTSYSLIVEISEETTFLRIAPSPTNRAVLLGRATFHQQTLARVTSLFTVIANKMNLPVNQPLGLMMMERGGGVASLPVSPGNTGMSDDKVKVRIGPDADVKIDGETWIPDEDDVDKEEEEEGGDGSGMDVDTGGGDSSRRRKRDDEDDDDEEWIVKKCQWRLRVQPVPPGNGKSGMEVVMGAVKIEGYRSERGRNADRGFLT